MSAVQAQAAADAIDAGCAGIPVIGALCGQATYSMDNNGNVLMNMQGLAVPICNPSCNVYKEVGGNQVPFASELESNVPLPNFGQALVVLGKSL